jgi:putative PIN family toxin of toxin-antitoxin system
MIWVVLDSNVYVSALVFGGNPRLILERAKQGLFEISISDPIKSDVERILALKFAWPAERIHEATSYLWPLTHLVDPQQTVADCIDPDDDRVLECALGSHAQVIVTGDNHLLKLHPYKNISILTPRQFLESKLWQDEKAT